MWKDKQSNLFIEPILDMEIMQLLPQKYNLGTSREGSQEKYKVLL